MRSGSAGRGEDGARSRQVDYALRELAQLLGNLEQRLGALGARVEALDASFLRHQGQQEGDLERVERGVGRVREQLDRHEDAHPRSGR